MLTISPLAGDERDVVRDLARAHVYDLRMREGKEWLRHHTRTLGGETNRNRPGERGDEENTERAVRYRHGAIMRDRRSRADAKRSGRS